MIAHKRCIVQHHFLTCLEPVVQQMLLVLADDQLTELHRLKGIQLATGEKSTKVHQQGGGLARLGWHPLELLDCLPSAQSPLSAARTKFISLLAIV